MKSPLLLSCFFIIFYVNLQLMACGTVDGEVRLTYMPLQRQ